MCQQSLLHLARVACLCSTVQRGAVSAHVERSTPNPSQRERAVYNHIGIHAWRCVLTAMDGAR
jgi:hypothetical protein